MARQRQRRPFVTSSWEESVQLRVFTIPIANPAATEDRLNAFLRGHRVVNVTKQFVANGENSLWSVLVEYLVDNPGRTEKRGKVDYKEVLTGEQFALFSALRQARKQLAETHGVPAYAVFTNEELASIATAEPHSRRALGEISGIGPSKLERYGQAMLDVIVGTDAADRQPV